jgi:predicted small metal-binding protein
MKSIQCRDLFPGCEFHAEAATEAELLRKAADHAAQVHGITQLTDEVIAKVRGCIREG